MVALEPGERQALARGAARGLFGKLLEALAFDECPPLLQAALAREAALRGETQFLRRYTLQEVGAVVREVGRGGIDCSESAAGRPHWGIGNTGNLGRGAGYVTPPYGRRPTSTVRQDPCRSRAKSWGSASTPSSRRSRLSRARSDSAARPGAPIPIKERTKSS